MPPGNGGVPGSARCPPGTSITGSSAMAPACPIGPSCPIAAGRFWPSDEGETDATDRGGAGGGCPGGGDWCRARAATTTRRARRRPAPATGRRTDQLGDGRAHPRGAVARAAGRLPRRSPPARSSTRAARCRCSPTPPPPSAPARSPTSTAPPSPTCSRSSTSSRPSRTPATSTSTTCSSSGCATRTHLDPELADAIEERILAFKYWWTEPTPEGVVDSQYYWTENHQIIFLANEYIAGQTFPDEVFTNSGMTGTRAHRAHADERLRKWFDCAGPVRVQRVAVERLLDRGHEGRAAARRVRRGRRDRPAGVHDPRHDVRRARRPPPAGHVRRPPTAARTRRTSSTAATRTPTRSPSWSSTRHADDVRPTPTTPRCWPPPSATGRRRSPGEIATSERDRGLPHEVEPAHRPQRAGRPRRRSALRHHVRGRGRAS